jgi:hypothetical protein
MRPRTAQRLLGTSVLLLFSAPLACSSSSSSEPSASPDASTDSATTVDPSDAGAQDDGSTSCTPPVNGQLAAPSGTFQATIVNGGANLTKAAPGTIPCEADFAANSGISLGNNQYTGSFSVTCWGNEGTLYFGLRVSAAAKPKTGDSFPVGLTTAVSGGGGFVSNGQSDLAWEEGPACDTKQDRSKEWNGEAAAGAGGAFVVDSVTGTDMTFHLTETNLTTSTNGLNYKGTGSFKLSGSGTVKVTGL